MHDSGRHSGDKRGEDHDDYHCLLPPAVRVVEAPASGCDTPPHPAEAALVARAVPRRREEFATGRRCAHAALRRLGVPDQPVLSTPRGAPVWPYGVVGSITHCVGYRAAAVARAEEVAGLGIDAEPALPLSPAVRRLVCAPDEVRHVERLGMAHPAVAWDRLLFSVKETVFKIWYPLTGRELGFDEAEVLLQPDGCWTARLSVTTAGAVLTRICGRWRARPSLLVTAAFIAAPSVSGSRNCDASHIRQNIVT